MIERIKSTHKESMIDESNELTLDPLDISDNWPANTHGQQKAVIPNNWYNRLGRVFKSRKHNKNKNEISKNELKLKIEKNKMGRCYYDNRTIYPPKTL